MARRDRLDHNGFKSRAKRYGLRAENVAYGCATEECARAKWWKSPGHARNMMLPGFKEVASARSRSGRTYWCMEIHE
ncbi:MAG: CAP domain-containing protein [Xanthobacteraceae bacterium]